MWIRMLFINMALMGSIMADTELPGITSIYLDPELIANQRGDSLIVWNTGGSIGGSIKYAICSSEGCSSTLTIPGMTTSNQYVTGAINDKKEALVIWSTVTGNVQYAIYDPVEQSMSSIYTIVGTNPYSSHPYLELNNQGNGIAVWSDADQNIQYAFYHRINQSFLKARALIGAKTQQEIQVAFNDQGLGLITWYDSEQQAICYAVCNENSTFGEIQTLRGTKDTMNLSLALNNQGAALLAWNTGSQAKPSGFVQYSIYNKKKNSFEVVNTLSSKEELAQNVTPQIALNNKGDGILVWCKLTADGKYPIWYARYQRGSKQLKNPQAIAGVDLYSAFPQATINDRGEIMAAWFSTQTGSIQYSTCNNTSKGFTSVHAIAGTQSTDQFPQISISNDGQGVIVWGALGKINYSLYNKTSQRFCISKSIP